MYLTVSYNSYFVTDTTIEMKIPVSIEYKHDENLNTSPSLSACFYLGSFYLNQDAPAPTSNNIALVTRDPMIVFTRFVIDGQPRKL